MRTTWEANSPLDYDDEPLTLRQRLAAAVKLIRDRAPLLIATALFVVIGSGYLYFSFRAHTPPVKAEAAKPRDAVPAVNAAAPTAAPEYTIWTNLEPAYRSLKVEVGNDNSLVAAKQAIELYAVKILPRSQICTYRSGERWACGQRAYIALLNILGGTTVDCRAKEAERPGVSVCRLPGTDISELMLREGWATLGSGVTEKRYVDAAASSYTNKTGMWAQQVSKTKN